MADTTVHFGPIERNLRWPLTSTSRCLHDSTKCLQPDHVRSRHEKKSPRPIGLPGGLANRIYQDRRAAVFIETEKPRGWRVALNRQRRFFHWWINIHHAGDNRVQFGAQRRLKRARDEVGARVDANLAFDLLVIRIQVIGHAHRPQRLISGGEPRRPVAQI